MALLTVRAAADRLGIGYSTLKQWIYQGKVRTTTTEGGHHRLSDAEIERLLARYPQSVQGKPGDSRRPKGLIVTLSGRNQLRGYVEEVRSDGLLGQVRLRIGDQVLTAVITSDALAELKLRRRRRAGHRQVDGSHDCPRGRQVSDRTQAPSPDPLA